MAGDLTDQEIEKRRREKARKRGKSAMRKALETGRDCEIFTAFVYWNPTHRRLEGTVYLPEDVDLPNVNDFLKKLVISGRRTERRTRTRQQHEQAKQVQDEIVVEPAQSSPEEDEPDEDQPSTPTLQSEATDHSGSRTDGNITQTINADSANQITRNEQSVDDMDIDSLRMDPEVEPSRVAPVSAGAEVNKGLMSADPDRDLVTDMSMANTLASDNPDWYAMANFSMDADVLKGCDALDGDEVTASVVSSKCLRAEDLAAAERVVRRMRELRGILLQWRPKETRLYQCSYTSIQAEPILE